MQCTVQESETNWSSHKKGTAPEKTSSKHLSDLTRKGLFLKKKLCHLTRKGLLLKNKQRPQSKLSQQITKCEWISGTLSQHVAWLCGSRFLSQGFCITPSVVKQCFKRIFEHFSYCPGDPTRSVQWVMIQDKPGRVLWSFVLDHSWTSFNQRPSDSRNCCRTREEPLKPCQEIIFSSTLFFFDGDKLIQSFSQHNKATKYAHVEDEHCTH